MNEEPRVPRLTVNDVPESTKRIFEALEKARGRVPNLFRVAAHRPLITEALQRLLAAVMGPGVVDVRLKELLSVRVSRINNCEY